MDNCGWNVKEAIRTRSKQDGEPVRRLLSINTSETSKRPVTQSESRGVSIAIWRKSQFIAVPDLMWTWHRGGNETSGVVLTVLLQKASVHLTGNDRICRCLSFVRNIGHLVEGMVS
jgi:hypothetical protein